MKAENLAEAIILQSIEDLWDESQRDGCIAFFAGEDFTTCARIARMSLSDQVKLLNIVRGLIPGLKKDARETRKEAAKDFGNRYSPRRVMPRKEYQLTL